MMYFELLTVFPLQGCVLQPSMYSLYRFNCNTLAKVYRAVVAGLQLLKQLFLTECQENMAKCQKISNFEL